MSIENINEKLEEVIKVNPDKIAVEYKDRRITYRQLKSEAASVASFLTGAGIHGENIILFMNKSDLLIFALLGVIRSGNIFAPVEPELPVSRIENLLTEIGTDRIITTAEQLEKLYPILCKLNREYSVLLMGCETWDVNDQNEQIHVYNSKEWSIINNAHTCYVDNKHCYLYFTSGSMGKPKGILGRQKSLMHFIDWEIEEFDLGEHCRVSLLTPISFDPFLRDVFVPLCAGGTLCIPDDKGIYENPIRMVDWVEEKRITLIHTVPTLFKMMISEIKTGSHFQNLQYILLAGEILRGNDVKRFYELFGKRIELVNLYGPSETTLAKVYYRLQEEDGDRAIIPIGKPISFTEVFILNDSLQKCADHVLGELYIRTPFISSGYYRNKELTKEVFLRNPFSKNPNDIIYKTGDLGRSLDDGTIEVIGRADNQVKIRGMRLEPAEIENKILDSGYVKEATVIGKKDKTGDLLLYAYVESEQSDPQEKIKTYLKKHLPEYMIPSYIIVLERLPLNVNGKIDRKKLMTMDGKTDSATTYIPPSNNTEERMTKLWENMFHLEKISVESQFFELGGHSIKAAKLIADIYREFQVELSFSDIFDNPTIKQLSSAVTKAKKQEYDRILPVEEKEFYEVSAAQSRLYTLYQFDKNEVNYNNTYVIHMEGKIEKDQVNEIFKQLVSRHEAFRTSFEFQDEDVIQHINKEIDFVIDYSEVKNPDSQRVKELVKEFVKPFDLSKAPLLRVKLVKIAENSFLLMVDMHHIISDGTSKWTILKDFITYYKGEHPEQLKIQYKDYSSWQNKIFKSEQFRQQEESWLKVFDGNIPVLNLPTDYKRPALQSFEGDTIKFYADATTTDKINQLSRTMGTTLYMTLLSAYNVLLHKYTGQEDIIVGTPIAGRNHSDLNDVVGIFVNTLAMRNYPSGDKSFQEFLNEVKEHSLAAYENQDYPFDKLVGKLAIKRDLSRNALFDTMFVLQNTEAKVIDGGDLKLSSYEFESSVSKFDIMLSGFEMKDGRMLFQLEYCTKLFKKSTVSRIAMHFLHILEFVSEHWEQKISEIDLLTEDEKIIVCSDFNDTKTKYPIHQTIHGLFEEQVERTPNKMAVSMDEKQLTYKELNEKANAIAIRLQDKGVGVDTPVAVLLNRSIEMVVYVFAILKAGGCILLMEAHTPKSRVDYILKDSKAVILITKEEILENGGFDTEVLLFESLETMSRAQSNPINRNTPNDLLYIIYTSGTTGMPKGVMLEHKNIVNLISYSYQKSNVDFTSNVLQFATCAFDPYYEEVFSTLLRGGSIFIIGEDEKKNVKNLFKYIEKNQVSIVFMPTAFFKFINNNEEYIDCIPKCIKHYIVAGEQLLVSEKFKYYLLEGDVYLHNYYGPAETHVVTTYTITGDNFTTYPPIGKPIINTKLYILDENKNIVPIGIPGELYITGDSVGRGYIGDEKLSKEKFTTSPFDPSERMYRSGDLARWLEDGNIEYLGRKDRQVKIRGFRVELGEIEDKLLSYENILEAVVIDREDDQRNKYLCAYITGTEPINIQTLREDLKKELPDHMIPSYFAQIDRMPMTNNGKTDRKALQNLEIEVNTGVDFVLPRNPLEEKLAHIWGEILAVEKVGIDDDFFLLGGDSFKAIKILLIVHKELEVEVPVSEVFRNPTIRQMGEYIKEVGKTAFTSIRPTAEHEVNIYKASSAQRRMYMLAQFDKGATNYNMPYITKVKGMFDKDKVEQVFQILIDRHEAFRTSFELQEEEIMQRIHGQIDFHIVYERLDNADNEKIKEIAKDFVKPFDLEMAPLLRVKLVDLDDGKQMLMVDMHHIISDGTSMAILIKEFLSIYKGENLK